MEQLRADPEGPKFAKPHPKGESIWGRQYEPPVVKGDLKDYPGRGSEIDVYKLRIVSGRGMAVEVGMCQKDYVVSDIVFLPFSPGDKYSSALWFYQPFSNLRPSLDLDVQLIADDDVGDNADNLETTPPTFSAFGESIVELPDADALNNCEVILDHNAIASNVSPTVNIPGCGKVIYKSKLIQMLNEDPKMSKDRLTRVRQRQEFT